MKKISLIIIGLFVLAACSKKEVKFETLSSEAFAYDIGNGIYEVNASIRVKGFTQNEKDGKYSSSISFSVDLQKPDSSVVKSIFKDVHKESDKEPISDVGLEAQFDLDSTYVEGQYKLIYNILDDISHKELTASVNFDISK
jgi:hypothetical protein